MKLIKAFNVICYFDKEPKTLTRYSIDKSNQLKNLVEFILNLGNIEGNSCSGLISISKTIEQKRTKPRKFISKLSGPVK